MTSNPLDCSCNILPFWTWLTARPSLGTTSRCDDGTLVFHITLTELDKCTRMYGLCNTTIAFLT